jgi:hypothetical protein
MSSFAIRSVELHDNVKDKTLEWNTTDIRVGKGNVDDNKDTWWPRANVGGISDVQTNKHNKTKHIYYAQFVESAFPSGSNYYKGIVHEFGHYGLYLWDEYCNWNSTIRNWQNLPKDKTPPTFMNDQRDYTDPSTPTTYLDTKYNQTEQWLSYHESCWETIFRKYFTEPRAKAGAVEGVDYIWFDLEREGVPDYTFPTWYIPEGGPYFNIGQFVHFSGDHA